MFRQWLRSLRPSRERNQPARRPRSFVPRVEGLEGRDVPSATLLAEGLARPTGSTIGPDGYLYVTEAYAEDGAGGHVGRIARIHPGTGEVTTFASGLPVSPFPEFYGVGAVDVEFLDRTAYVLATLVGEDLGGDAVVGIYRVDGPNEFTVIADIGAWSVENPPDPDIDIFVPTGSQYAMESYRGGFLVTDGHHNRVLHVELDGDITEVIAFGNIVPTGLAVRGNRVYMAQAGPIPHEPADGKVVSFRPGSPAVRQVAAGAPLLVDVEFGRGNALYALAQGDWEEGTFEGDPALPNTGSLVRANRDGTFSVIEDGLDRPSSLEFTRGDAYVVTLGGQVLRIDTGGDDDDLTAQSAAVRPVNQTLRPDQARPLLQEAIRRWAGAGVDTSAMRGIQLRVADLGGTTLGRASGRTIWLDDNAAGWGWFVDRTPRSDTEFARPGNQGEQRRMDLLTVLMHEVGHVLGHDHAAGGVMAETLSTGVRPGLPAADGLFADPWPIRRR
jgi:hypothetical protein